MRHRHVTRAATLGLAVAAIAAPAASAQTASQSPDARDANQAALASHNVIPVQSPDARDANQAWLARHTTVVPSPDARDANQAALAGRTIVQSPDARDANQAALGVERPTPRFVVVPGPAPATDAGGLHWDDAGIGAAGLLGLVVLGTGGVLLAVRRRPGQPESANPAA